jgi:hypothetical protein
VGCATRHKNHRGRVATKRKVTIRPGPRCENCPIPLALAFLKQRSCKSLLRWRHTKPVTCLCYGSRFLSRRRKFLRRIAARSEQMNMIWHANNVKELRLRPLQQLFRSHDENASYRSPPPGGNDSLHLESSATLPTSVRGKRTMGARCTERTQGQRAERYRFRVASKLSRWHRAR